MTSWEFRQKYGSKSRAKRKPKSELQKLEKQADDWFSRMVRLRASDSRGMGKCCSCGKFVDIKYNDCGHFIPRGYYSVRWDSMNAHLQCKGCNMRMMDPEVQAGYRRFMHSNYTKDRLQKLATKKHNKFKKERFILELIIKENKQKVAILLKQKGLSKWW